MGGQLPHPRDGPRPFPHSVDPFRGDPFKAHRGADNSADDRRRRLVLAALHSNNADQTMDRVINFFPAAIHKQILQSLALNLKGIISLRLVMAKTGRRRAAVEILVNTPMIRDMIRRGETADLKEAMERSLDAGMQTFDQSLYSLYKDGTIELEEALSKADSHDGLKLKIKLAEGASGDESSELSDDLAYDPSSF